MNKPLIIGFAGTMGAGKTTMAYHTMEILAAWLENKNVFTEVLKFTDTKCIKLEYDNGIIAAKLSFADSLKKCVSTQYNLSDRSIKSKPAPAEWAIDLVVFKLGTRTLQQAFSSNYEREKFTNKLDELNIKYEVKINYLRTWRELTVDVGTIALRNVVHPNWHILKVEEQIKQDKYNIVVLDDVRFQNEADWIEDNHGFVIKLDRQMARPDSDAEKAAANLVPTRTIDNANLSVEETARKVQQTVVEIISHRFNKLKNPVRRGRQDNEG